MARNGLGRVEDAGGQPGIDVDVLDTQQPVDRREFVLDEATKMASSATATGMAIG